MSLFFSQTKVQCVATVLENVNTCTPFYTCNTNSEMRCFSCPVVVTKILCEEWYFYNYTIFIIKTLMSNLLCDLQVIYIIIFWNKGIKWKYAYTLLTNSVDKKSQMVHIFELIFRYLHVFFPMRPMISFNWYHSQNNFKWVKLKMVCAPY